MFSLFVKIALVSAVFAFIYYIVKKDYDEKPYDEKNEFTEYLQNAKVTLLVFLYGAVLVLLIIKN